MDDIKSTVTFIRLKKEVSLEIAEVDILSQTVQKRFMVPQLYEEGIVFSECSNEPIESKHTYHIFYHKSHEHMLFLAMPYGCVAIFDYHEAILSNVYKTDLRYENILHSTILTSPQFENTVFCVTDRLAIYNINKPQKPQKLKLPSDVIVNQMQVHPVYGLLFVACSDGQIRVYDFATLKELPPYQLKDSASKSMTTIDFSISGDFLVAGDEQGNAIIWDTSQTKNNDDREIEN